MAGVRFTEVQSRPTEFLDLTSVTLEEFEQLVPPFEAAFQAHMAVCDSMAHPAPRASLPCTKTARYPRRKIACSSS